MSVSSRNSSKKKTAVDAPFDPKFAAEAWAIVDQYRILIEIEDGHYYGHAVEMPYAMGDGSTPEACYESTRQGVFAGVATMIEQGEEPPLAQGESRRSEQINIRLTTREKFQLEQATRQHGFRGVSDFVRNASLTAARPAKRQKRTRK